MRYEKASQNKEMQASPGSNVAQLEQTANSRLKMMQPRTTGPYHKSFQTFLFFFFPFLPKLLAWGKRYILAFLLLSVWCHWSGFFLLPCLGCAQILIGCHRWRLPWWRHWSGQKWAPSQTKPWRCFWTDASLRPSLSAAILLQPQSPPCSGWWRQAGQC